MTAFHVEHHRLTRIRPPYKSLLNVLCHLASNDDNTCNPTTHNLRQRMCVSEAFLESSIQALEDMGLIRVTRGDTTVYEVVMFATQFASSNDARSVSHDA